MIPRAIWAQERRLQQSERAPLLGRVEKGYGAKGMGRLPEAKPEPQPFTGTWMAYVDDDTEVSTLTIPGTHDSAAFTTSWPFIQTQKMDIVQQLNAGIRYFDLRCGLQDDEVEMVHGAAVLGIHLTVILDIMYLWLMSHTTEGLVVQIKQDRAPEKSTMHFSHAIWKVLAQNPTRWRTANTNPKLGHLRGRIQLLRRYTGPTLHAYGIDVTQWEDNPSKPFTINTKHAVQITIQDHYSFPDPEGLPGLIAKKGGDVAELLDRAVASTDSNHWYLNFTSAYEFNLWYQLPPREIAIGGYWAFKWIEGMNVRLRGYLANHKGKRRYGIVAMDFPESGAEDLIVALIRSNFERSPDQHHSFDWTYAMEIVLFVVVALLIIMAMLSFMSTR